MTRMGIAAALSFPLLLACSRTPGNSRSGSGSAAAGTPSQPAAAEASGMTITSPAFQHNGMIPVTYTCNGASTIPPLLFSSVPQGALSLALVVTDPDAPRGTFTHWLVWDLPTTVTRIEEGQRPTVGVEGMNDFGRTGWGSPCPPSGVHRYVFDLYALNATLGLPSSTRRDALEKAIRSHVVAHAHLVGRYGKS